MKTFTTYKLHLDGTLSHKELLGQDELNQWMIDIHGKHATVKIVCDQTGEDHVYTDTGEWWEQVS